MPDVTLFKERMPLFLEQGSGNYRQRAKGVGSVEVLGSCSLDEWKTTDFSPLDKDSAMK